MLEHSVKKVSLNQTQSSDIPLWDIRYFKKALKMEVIKLNDVDMEFDIVGINCSFVNALRRVLLAEVPMMAIEKVHVYNNTSIIQDEVLAHRLGLIPLKADPRKFSFKEEEETMTTSDTLEFHLKVKCTKNSKSLISKSTQDSLEEYKNVKVYTKQMRWVPIGEQNTIFKAEDVGPVHNDILLAKLRPGHELDLKLFAVKGIGKDHAKFQPVATVSYRLLPEISLLKDVEGEKAQRLKSSFSPGVIELVKEKGTLKARVANARYDSCSRNVYRYDDLKDCVKLSRVPDHYIFTIESVGALTPDILFLEAIKVLKEKCKRLLNEINVNGKTSFL